ncbi:MAG TPA: hypothetical protein VEC39_01925, partial [Vicinamibacterales bacterium]|nr:hypothetical protein [Vicinamibacterales bacterium]
MTAGRIRESFGERTTPSQLHALGVAQLLAGRHDDAALSLLAAAREQPANARYLNDVATLQLERARLGLRPDDLPRALAAADRARRLDPSLHEAWFNHALAMNALSLRDQARASWMEYLRRDRSSAWASEARAHLEALNQPTPAQAWASLEGRLHQALDAATADHAVRTHTTEARHFIEDTLLPQWASAVGDGGDGAAELQQLRLMADAMLRVAGDALYRDVVGSIDRAGTEGATAVRQLASAHRAYADAARLFVQDRFAEAGPALATAQKALAALKSPFAHRVAVDLAGTILVRGDYEGTLAAIRDAKGSASALGYAYVAARATWFEGLIAFAQGRLSDTQFLYEELLAAFERMGDAEQTALAHNLLASYFYYLGDKPSEWKHREQALKGLAVSRSQRFRTQIVNTVALSLRQDNPEGALTLYNEALTHARAGRTVLVIEVLAQRATTLAMLGRWSEAAVDVAEARRELASIREPRLQQLYELLILAPEGELQRQRDASQAVATAARALDLIAARNNPSDRIRVPVFQLQLAKANVVWGRTHAAKVALANGIRAFDEERASMPDEGRLSALDQSWQLFEVAVQIAIKEKDFAKAFEMSERARTRTLAEARRAAAPRSLADAQASLADDEAIVALNQFNDELAVWVIRKHTLQVQVRAVRRVDAARLIARQHHEMWTKATQPNASQELFDQIIRPVFDGLRDVGRLVVVPDHTYQDAAFAGFWDASHRRYLVETVSIALSPTVDGYLSAKQSPIEASARDPLILGGPDREADEVARAVAAAYPTASLLTGASATRTRFFGEA